MQILQAGENDVKSIIVLLFLILIMSAILICFFSLEKTQQGNIIYLEKVMKT